MKLLRTFKEKWKYLLRLYFTLLKTDRIVSGRIIKWLWVLLSRKFWICFTNKFQIEKNCIYFQGKLVLKPPSYWRREIFISKVLQSHNFVFPCITKNNWEKTVKILYETKPQHISSPIITYKSDTEGYEVRPALRNYCQLYIFN